MHNLKCWQVGLTTIFSKNFTPITALSNVCHVNLGHHAQILG